MRKIVSGFACSLDGYIEGSSGEYDWILVNPEIDFAEQMKRFDAYLYGRRTYEAVVKMGSAYIPRAKNYVFSTTLDSVQDGFELVKGDVAEELKKIKSLPGKDIALFGGASLLATLLNLRLVDEMEISIIPVLLGSGKPMVEALSNKVWLRHEGSKNWANGTVSLKYSVTYQIPETK